MIFRDIPIWPRSKPNIARPSTARATLAGEPEAIVEEGALAFTLNIDLSCAVQAALQPAANAAE